MIDRLSPAVFVWDGERMLPVPAAVQLCQRQFVVGMRYRLAEYEPRSRAAHNYYFAWLEEAFRQLPERYAMQFSSPEHLRKWALCRTQYRNVRKIACASKKEAQRVAAFVKRGNRRRGETFYAEVSVKGTVVVEITPKSQAMKEMNRKQFLDSMEQVREIIAELIGVTPDQIGAAAREVS
jgi:hypothetical protein